jgi:ribosomal protein S18 acetylase RimI-like enzyme
MLSYSLKQTKTRNILLFIISAAILSGALAFWWHGSSLFQKSPITPYKSGDRDAIMQLLKDDWYWLVSDGATDFSAGYMLEHHAATLHYPDNTLSISVYRTPENKIAGFVTYHRLEGYKGRIQFLAVAKEFRKKGYARELMAHAINGLQKMGMCFIEIAVRSNNIPAFNLYKKFGFKEIWSTPDGFLGMNKSLCESKQQASHPAPIDW